MNLVQCYKFIGELCPDTYAWALPLQKCVCSDSVCSLIIAGWKCDTDVGLHRARRSWGPCEDALSVTRQACSCTSKNNERCIKLSMIALIASPRLIYHIESLSNFNLNNILFDVHIIDCSLQSRCHFLVILPNLLHSVFVYPTSFNVNQHQRPTIAFSGTIFSKKIAFG